MEQIKLIKLNASSRIVTNNPDSSMKDDKSVAEETKVNEIVTDDNTVKMEIESKPAQETEWTCDHCKSLNFMIYDDRESSYCICKCFYYNEIF